MGKHIVQRNRCAVTVTKKGNRQPGRGCARGLHDQMQIVLEVREAPHVTPAAPGPAMAPTIEQGHVQTVAREGGGRVAVKAAVNREPVKQHQNAPGRALWWGDSLDIQGGSVRRGQDLFDGRQGLASLIVSAERLPGPRHMRISEIYRSIQGETQYAGLPCTLVRTTGCDLRCGYCDSAFAFTGGRDMSLAEIVAEVDRLGAPWSF